MQPFGLEDFFDKHEHRSDVINLASSDALPWTVGELKALGLALPSAKASFKYPDLAQLKSELKTYLRPPAGFVVLPTAGVAEAIALVLHEFADVTARLGCVAVARPNYGAFGGLADLLGLKVKTYDYSPKRGWALDLDEMRTSTRDCGLVTIANPHNPTGSILGAHALKQIAEESAARGGSILVDEIFRLPQETRSMAGAAENVLVIGGVSKTFGLPGLRLGWIVAHASRVERLRTVQQYLSLSLSAQAVALGAEVLRHWKSVSRSDLIKHNRKIVEAWAAEHADIVEISRPTSGATVCLTVRRPADQLAMFDHLVANKVMLAPGQPCFDFMPDLCWFRLSYGADTRLLTNGLKRVAKAIRSLD